MHPLKLKEVPVICSAMDMQEAVQGGSTSRGQLAAQQGLVRASGWVGWASRYVARVEVGRW